MSKAYALYKDGTEVNRIQADEAFVTEYAAQNGYTFEEIAYSEPAEETPVSERLETLENNNTTLTAQLEATQAALDYLLLNTI